MRLLTSNKRGYKVRERPVVRASYNGKIAHSNAGNLEVGKAWRALRRPSDLVSCLFPGMEYGPVS